MKPRENPNRLRLTNGSRIGVIGGGPAGAFFAIHLLNRARALGLDLSLHIFERRRSDATASQCPGANWKGCNYCAGGLSPKLIETLEEMGLAVPESIVQGKVRSITIEGHWKNIEFHVPDDRKMLAVYRGSRPTGRPDSRASFDSFLLDEAIRAGAHLAGAEITGADFTPAGRPLLGHQTSTGTQWTELDFVVFASGVNEMASCVHHGIPLLDTIRRLMPAFVPPGLRRTLIFELEADPHLLTSLDGQVHFPEYGSRMLRLEMCSIIPKRGFITVVLVGGSVDQARTKVDYQRILGHFLELPHIHRLLARCDHTRMACFCNPSMVVGTARHPFTDRVAVVGDLATTRLYKDGILSACQTARALADTALEAGIDARSLAQGYLPAIERFRRDNRFAAVVFRLHRIFFSSPMLSRVLYQAVITERKNSWRGERRLKRLLWQIASGDAQYEDIFYSAIHPTTVWLVFTNGWLLTLRNYFTECLFGLDWRGFGRFTTGVARERLEGKRAEFARLITESDIAVPNRLEFERMYTIRILAPRRQILEQLGTFGEPNRKFLKARFLRVARTDGRPNEPGCVIRYTVIHRRLHFSLVLEQIRGGHLLVYRVRDGFARGGVLLFEIEQLTEESCNLSIYVAFNFQRGGGWLSRAFWHAFRWLFPAFVHDVIWNHSLCQLKDVAEQEYIASIPSAPTPSPGEPCR